MKLCIDGFAASNLPGTNIFSYSKEIITLINSKDTINPYILWDRFPLSFYWDRLENTKFVPLKLDRLSNDYSSIEKFIESNNIDIFHSPNDGFSIPKNKCCQYITTIHSLYPIIYKDNVDEKYLNKFTKMVPYAIEKSDKVIAISPIVKRDLIKHFNVPEDKIKIVYPKCSEIFVPKEDKFCKGFIKRHYNIDYPYILYVGSIISKKKLDSVINILKESKKKIKDLKLVVIGDISGKRESYYLKIKELIASYNLEDSVNFLGIIKQTHLPIFYKSSVCVIDLDEYNSYPLSAVEAINSGAIVVVNKTEINVKVLNKCAVYCDLSQINILADFIEGIYSNYDYREKILSMIEKPISSSDENILSIYD
ncbi:glycosyltransferase [Clostridium fallax]|uniref:Glycosyltransferase involved in cell wall bisynthesis n=1 Tax=Clostridium fallax TaxID=1533 RepID=A0A1M4WGU8_9CLOT|nr:glycosyltransferase [Clostridium fallax]SHE80293.1 Glycosyltransferase involved in cell wall bisynthesis [Clostridium fallax]SQB04955.1 mannosyltransferase [Clostridium fallax]